MESSQWRAQLWSLGIRVKRLTSLGDRPEARVFRVEGTRHGDPVVCYLKRSRLGMGRESVIYGFAARHPDFPAPAATPLMLNGEEWLLLDRADGDRLADLAVADIPGAYVTAARGMAGFHALAAASGWTASLSCLEVLNERIEALPSSALENLRRKVVRGSYSAVEPALLAQVEAASARSWPGFANAFRSYPDSLIHGDCHYGNLFLDPEGAICLIDWASAAIAPGLLDLAALVDVTQRMRAPIDPEPDVLTAYFGELPQAQQDAYGKPEHAWAVCRAVRAFLELEWFVTTGEDYGARAQRELALLHTSLLSGA